MKKNHLVVLILLGVALTAVCLLLWQRDQNSWQNNPATAGGKVLDSFDPNAVAEIAITGPANEVVLVRKNGEWIVRQSDYAADFTGVSGTIRQLWDLKAVQDVEADPSQFGRLGLNEPGPGKSDTATLIDLKDATGKRLAALLVGKTYQRENPSMPGMGFPVGRYVMALNGRDRPVLTSETFQEVDLAPKLWLKRDFLRMGDPLSISVDSTNPPARWTLERPEANAEWTMEKNTQPLDTGKISSLVQNLQGLGFSDVLPKDADKAKYGLDKPGRLTVKTSDHFTYRFDLGAAQGDEYPVQISVAGDFPSQPPSPDGQKPEEKEKSDREWAEKRAVFEKRMAADKIYERRIFLIPTASLSNVLVPADQLLAPPPAPDPSAIPVSPDR